MDARSKLSGVAAYLAWSWAPCRSWQLRAMQQRIKQLKTGPHSPFISLSVTLSISSWPLLLNKDIAESRAVFFRNRFSCNAMLTPFCIRVFIENVLAKATWAIRRGQTVRGKFVWTIKSCRTAGQKGSCDCKQWKYFSWILYFRHLEETAVGQAGAKRDDAHVVGRQRCSAVPHTLSWNC